MISMTGFGTAAINTDNMRIDAELKTVNSRYLDIVISLPPLLSNLEIRIREHLMKRFHRGRVEFCVKIDGSGRLMSVSVDEEMAKKWLAALKQLAALEGSNRQPSLDVLASKEEIFLIERQHRSEEYWPHIDRLLIDLENQAYAYREQEGLSLAQDIHTQLAAVETALQSIAEHMPHVRTEIEESLRSGFLSVLGSEVNEAHVVSETAAWIVKFDLNEEIIRLHAHIDTFRKECNTPSPMGKKLDFLTQEMVREVNTIGAKAIKAEISLLVVRMKEALERIREQLRNVE